MEKKRGNCIRKYLIKDRGGKVTWVTLTYDDATDIYSVKFRHDINTLYDIPTAFVNCFIKKGMYELTPEFSRM